MSTDGWASGFVHRGVASQLFIPRRFVFFMAKIFFSNLGCKLNQAEVEDYGRQLERDGHEFASSLEEADVHVINSCTVTHAAARDSRKIVRRGKRMRAGVRTVLTGCWSASDTEEADRLVGDGLVVPNLEKERLVERLYQAWPDLQPTQRLQTGPGLETPEVPVSYVPLPFENARGALKVEDGCNMTCAFCIIPSTRGRQRSRTVEEVLAEFRGLASRGLGEIVVTGVQISSYRDGSGRLYDLVCRLLEADCGPRIRLSSIAPWQFDRRLLDLWPDSRLCRHFHLSLQSGDDGVLRRMRRPYTSATYAELLTEVRERIPGVAITTDVIVGFPGETEADFERSLEFVESCRFARVHVFPYSERPNTRSAELTDDVPPPVKKERVLRLREASAVAAAAFVEERVGVELRVLWERAVGDRLEGTSDDYVRCSVALDQVVGTRPAKPLAAGDLVGTETTVMGASRRGEILTCASASRTEGGRTEGPKTFRARRLAVL